MTTRTLWILALLVALIVAPRAHALTSGNAFITVQNGQVSITGALTVTNGGTGLATLTAHAVQVGAGTSNVVQVAPGTTGIPLLSQGAASDPAFTAINLSDTNVTTANALPISRGGTNSTAALANGKCIHSSGGALVEAAADCGTPNNSVNGFGTNGALTQNSTVYTNLEGCTDSTDLNCESIVQGTHTWKNLQCWNDLAQGTGANHDIVIQTAKGSCGTAFASLTTASMPTCTITGSASANQSCTADTTNTLNPTAGQCVVVRILSQSAVTAGNSHVNCTIEQVS